MALTRKQWIILSSVGVILVIATTLGITLGVVVGRKQSKQQRAQDILAQNPLIDG
jgi:hypothetical protein